ncbi:glycosyltransferase family 4 protein [Hymenobacter sp.]|uniref:glycosyltransferase family 4 protein n=1 Tax=Hymenobacter sp. TaxID=1898978 RepID=UPI00286C31AE|nr:glycosyltransferase family 4 protein [Hymenobacter sp.]
MNILLVSMMVPEAPSGVRVHYQRLAAGLRGLGHTVTVLTPASVSRGQSRRWGALRRVLDLAGPLGRHLGAELHGCANIYSALDRRAVYDVVNAQDATTGWLLRRLLGPAVPVVVTGHFNDHPGREVVRQLGLRGRAARVVVRWHEFFLARTAHFVSVSGYVQGRVAPLLPAHARHAVVHHGLDLAQFAAVAPDVALRARAAGRPVLLNIGHLEGRKNQRFLLAVAAELRALGTDFLLGLVGTGPDEALLRARIATAGLQDCVWLAGHRADVAALLRASTVYVHAATNESFGLVLLEAMACAVPVLALGVGAVPEVLAHDPAALIAPDAPPAAVARRLHELLADPAAQTRLQLRQRAHAAARFDLPAMLAGTVAAYESARRAATPTPAPPARAILAAP